jgi:4-hydroxybutyrate CoA-transferase
MNWKEKYKDKLVSADEAVSHVQSGDKIIFGDWVGEPPSVVAALIRRAPELRNVEIIHGLSPGPNEHLKPEYSKSFHHTALFLSARTRKPYAEGRLDYIGCTTFHKWPDMFAKNPDLNPHWAFIQVAPPDEEDLCSFGNSCCYTEPAARTAKFIIAQVNEKMPTLGGKKFRLSDADYIVAANDPLYTIGRASGTPTIEKIARNVAQLVEDGATLQLGIGALPDAILANLRNKKDLGIHSETLTESIMELVQAGVITNKRKTLNPGICVGAQAAGSEEFYAFIDHNPMFAVYPVDYVNDPYVVGQNYKMTSINACLSVDLLGQVTAECLNGRQYSGIGGQLDHVRGSQLSEGGKSILTLASTAKKGTVSTIVPSFVAGTAVSVSRYDVNYIVTEYGIANLKYRTVRQRAVDLIGIAHPKFREELTRQAKALGFI